MWTPLLLIIGFLKFKLNRANIVCLSWHSSAPKPWRELMSWDMTRQCPESAQEKHRCHPGSSCYVAQPNSTRLQIIRREIPSLKALSFITAWFGSCYLMSSRVNFGKNTQNRNVSVSGALADPACSAPITPSVPLPLTLTGFFPMFSIMLSISSKNNHTGFTMFWLAYFSRHKVFI